MNDLNELLEHDHQQWLALPCTQQLLKRLKEHSDGTIGLACQNVYNSDVKDDGIRLLVGNVANIKAVITMISDTNAFLGKKKGTVTNDN